LRAHLCKFATGVNGTGSKFAAGVNNIGGKFSLVSTTLVVNLRHQWQIMGTLSVYLHLKVKSVSICLLYYPKVFKKINTFLIEICHLPFETVQMGYSGAWRKLIHENNMK
jgi:hypothetical protein